MNPSGRLLMMTINSRLDRNLLTTTELYIPLLWPEGRNSYLYCICISATLSRFFTTNKPKPYSFMHPFSFHPIADGKYCFTAGRDRTVRLWNPSRLDPAHLSSSQRALPIQSYTHVHSVAAICVDSNTLVAGSGNSVVVTDLITTTPLRTFSSHTDRKSVV